MCNASCIIFGYKNLSREEIEGKRIIEIGSRDVNGSLRPIIESYSISGYVGVDIEAGPGVDKICSALDVVKEFGKESFDIVIATELLEHIRNWRLAVANIKEICKPEGIILVTTRSLGCPYHSFPYDFWRFEIEDMGSIFSDCIIEKLEKDKEEPGVFLKARKPKGFAIKDLTEYELYSLILNKRAREVSALDCEAFQGKLLLKQSLKRKAQIIKKPISKAVNFLLRLGR